ncbi:MAG: hypothetical protein ACWGSQ_16325 [Longimicrobiales bacterium]
MKGIKAFAALLVMATIPASLSGQETLVIPPEIMEAIQSDVATIHMDLMQANIVLQEGQAGKFWPVYDEYLTELKTLAAERTELIKDFALAFGSMTDATAVEMGRRALAFDARRNELAAKYFDRIAEEVGGIVAGQFLQIEARIWTIKDMRIAIEIPILGG